MHRPASGMISMVTFFVVSEQLWMSFILVYFQDRLVKKLTVLAPPIMCLIQRQPLLVVPPPLPSYLKNRSTPLVIVNVNSNSAALRKSYSSCYFNMNWWIVTIREKSVMMKTKVLGCFSDAFTALLVWFPSYYFGKLLFWLSYVCNGSFPPNCGSLTCKTVAGLRIDDANRYVRSSGPNSVLPIALILQHAIGWAVTTTKITLLFTVS
jgi:hypothetical protein